jgi:integrase/recombinase XerD
VKSLRRTLADYLCLRRSLGFKMLNESAALPAFVSFVEKRKSPCITTRLALDWAQQGREGQSKWRFSMVRGLAKHAAIFDARTEVPELGLLRTKYPRPRPYIYSDQEIERLVRVAREWGHDRPRTTYHSLLGLLAVSGLRLGEAIRLQVDDVDLATGILTIRNSKFGKSRLVPIHASTARKLREYKRQRDRFLGPRPSTHFFMTRTGTPLRQPTLHIVFKKLLVRAGIRDVTSRGGPRLHDLRHRFAVRTLIDWYRSGKDIEAHLPVLSTFLGHACVRSTYWYLNEHPELMKLAVQRLDARWEGTL